MKSSGVVELVGQLTTVDVASGDVECCTRVLEGLSRVIAWAEAGKVVVAQRLSVLAVEESTIFPEHVVATATRVSLGHATEPFKRAAAIEAMPQLGRALEGGAVSVGHVDVVAAAITKLDTVELERFATHANFLAEVAQRSTPGEFARTVRVEMLRSQRGDGSDTLRRQKQATYLKTWVDTTSGMWCLHGEFDPETGVSIHNRLRRTIEKLFHDAAPDTAPRDPLDKQHHLRALALVAVVNGTGAMGAAIDMSILIDVTTLVHGHHDGTVIDCGLPIELRIETIRRMACLADIIPIIVGADGVQLYLGATTRLATPQQRRALRAMYRTCAIPGCCVSWDQLVMHHLEYFEHGGPSDIDNLLPLCSTHHHYVHDGGWRLRMSADRTLTIALPDGATMCHGPPKALAA